MIRAITLLILFSCTTFANYPKGINGCISGKLTKKEKCYETINAYQKVLDLYAQSKDKLTQSIISQLKMIKDQNSYNYFAIYAAAAFDLQKTEKELIRITRIENKTKMKLKFSQAALNRLQGKKCENKEYYFEVCEYRDPRITRLEKYYQ